MFKLNLKVLHKKLRLCHCKVFVEEKLYQRVDLSCVLGGGASTVTLTEGVFGRFTVISIIL